VAAGWLVWVKRRFIHPVIPMSLAALLQRREVLVGQFRHGAISLALGLSLTSRSSIVAATKVAA
jgi:hypothetical protein